MSASIISGDVKTKSATQLETGPEFGDKTLDPGRITTQEHRGAIGDLERMYGAAMKDGGLDEPKKASLAAKMNSTSTALTDAHLDNAHGDSFGTAVEPRRAADGGIIFEAAPSLEDVKSGKGTIAIGQKGEGVNIVQQKLFDGGHYQGLYDEGTDSMKIVDSMNGDKTTAAIRSWQKTSGFEATGTLDKDGLSALLEGRVNTTKAHGKAQDWWAGPQDEARAALSVDATVFKQNKADLFAGTTENQQIKDARGRAVADGATNTGVGAEYNVSVAEVKGNVGDSKGTGADGRVAVEADAYAGAEVSHKVSDKGAAFSGKAGAYAGVDATAEGGVGFRYFGVGAKASAGVGAGGVVEGHAAYENGRASVGIFAKAGKGITGGAGGELWIDFGKIKDDALAAHDWAKKTVSGLFGGINWGRN